MTNNDLAGNFNSHSSVFSSAASTADEGGGGGVSLPPPSDRLGSRSRLDSFSPHNLKSMRVEAPKLRL
ncbi:hypothetical protein KCU79_g139, partial [Aureobasidium melanogenum]